MKRLTVLLVVLAVLISTITACAPQIDSGPTTAPTLPQTEAFEEQLPVIEAALMISEVMPDNRNVVLGHEWDWIELYNPDDLFGSLNGYYLTDDLSQPKAMPLDTYSIDAGGYLIVALDDSAPFQLSEMGETVYLFREDTVISELTFGTADRGASFDEKGICEYPTPGFANSREGYFAYTQAQTLPELIISEVMADNDLYSTDGFYYDYVEVENRSDEAIDLGAYYLTDGWESTERFYFPEITLEPGGCYIVHCSADAVLGDNHAPFSIGAGETLYLARQGSFIDALTIPEDLKSSESFGRDGNLPVYLKEATPGAKNTEGYFGGVAVPAASIAPGQYDEAVTVELTGEGTIYYTLDGARPTTASQVYQEPILVDGITTIRAMCVSNENRSSTVCNYAYAIGVEHDMPILVISMPLSSRMQLLRNIKSNQEQEAVMTLIEDGEIKFSVPFGMRLHGNGSRMGAKKNFQLRFRGEYGAGKLEYRLFEDRDIDEFNSLLLKGGSEDYINAMVRDELATSIANGTSALYTQAMKPVVLYLGGDYWGIHYLRERFSASYVASHLGVSEESVDMLFSSSGAVQVGSASSFSALKRYVQNHDMSTLENYAYLTEQIDVISLIDWYAFRTYLDDRDLANIRRFRSVESDGKWRWMFFDMDWGFYNQGSYPVGDIMADHNGEPILMRAVLASAAGRDAFLKRYAYLMETALNEAYINQCLDEILTQIESEMPRDRERWGFSYNAWEVHIQLIRDFAKDEKRVPLILNDLQVYFQLSDEQMEYYFGNLL